MKFTAIDSKQWEEVIARSDDLDLNSFSLKILLRQLKVKIELNPGVETTNNCIKNLKSHIVKYHSLPNLQKDLENIFGQKVEI